MICRIAGLLHFILQWCDAANAVIMGALMSKVKLTLRDEAFVLKGDLNITQRMVRTVTSRL